MTKRPWYEALFGLVFLLCGFGLGLKAHGHSVFLGWIVAILWMGAGSWILFRTRATLLDDFSTQFYADIQKISTDELVLELENPELNETDRFRLLRYLNQQRPGWTGSCTPNSLDPHSGSFAFFPD